ncbi:MAG: HAMP domain-containing histidine kinase [Candidatus Eisenbacteria bacterium]|uniref:histidine kinase n=1 Tax=Eiseniibacteriota bacterium TaxID=2212470 RepID=A0A933SBQ0_UNCEI|nr:HAMP domain-containing histidine kinase [Candidatus Eisenbacteria bacterium]
MPGAIGPVRLDVKALFKTGLFIGGGLLVAAVFLFTHQMVQRLSTEVATTSRVLARFCAEASLPATRNPELRRLLGEVLENVDFPIVITDTTGLPRAWQDVGVPHKLVSEESIDSLAAGWPVSEKTKLFVDGVRARIPELDRKNKPIPMWQTRPDSLRLGYVHYGEPVVLNRLRWMPFLAIGGTGLLMLLAFGGLAGIRAAEKRTIWVGMAKETAHQLGTPLSSLMGWVELLRANVESAPPGSAVTIPQAELAETLDDMEGDIDRLNKVAQRFSHIGSAPQLHLQDVTPVVREAVQYMRRRVSQREGGIEIRERYEEVPPVNLNRELLEWAVENLLTNAISALDKSPGVIEVTVERRAETEEVEVLVGDNGRGMSREEQRRAFEPGYTTKRRGWGLGLALARRVVEDYHAGRIGIRHSAPGQGTIMVIRFPT